MVSEADASAASGPAESNHEPQRLSGFAGKDSLLSASRALGPANARRFR